MKPCLTKLKMRSVCRYSLARSLVRAHMHAFVRAFVRVEREEGGWVVHLETGNTAFVDHAWWATHGGHGALSGWKAMLLDERLSDVASAVRPLLPFSGVRHCIRWHNLTMRCPAPKACVNLHCGMAIYRQISDQKHLGIGKLIPQCMMFVTAVN